MSHLWSNRLAITASQRSNDVSLSADDVVNVYLWPGGVRGFEYIFSVNPNGAHATSSSENSAFAPTWKPSRGFAITAMSLRNEFPST